MATSKVIKADDRGYQAGNQLKIYIRLKEQNNQVNDFGRLVHGDEEGGGGQWFLFKPRWYYERDKVVDNVTSCLIKDIHTSEIAGFHMAR